MIRCQYALPGSYLAHSRINSRKAAHSRSCRNDHPLYQSTQRPSHFYHDDDHWCTKLFFPFLLTVRYQGRNAYFGFRVRDGRVRSFLLVRKPWNLIMLGVCLRRELVKHFNFLLGRSNSSQLYWAALVRTQLLVLDKASDGHFPCHLIPVAYGSVSSI